jgi:hypothetical protein
MLLNLHELLDLERNKLTVGSAFGNLQCLCGQVLAPRHKALITLHFSGLPCLLEFVYQKFNKAF